MPEPAEVVVDAAVGLVFFFSTRVLPPGRLGAAVGFVFFSTRVLPPKRGGAAIGLVATHHRAPADAAAARGGKAGVAAQLRPGSRADRVAPAQIPVRRRGHGVPGHGAPPRGPGVPAHRGEAVRAAQGERGRARPHPAGPHPLQRRLRPRRLHHVGVQPPRVRPPAPPPRAGVGRHAPRAGRRLPPHAPPRRPRGGAGGAPPQVAPRGARARRCRHVQRRLRPGLPRQNHVRVVKIANHPTL
jgi:hypothetical protein